MNRWKSTWSPLLLGMLLMAVLVGVAGDGTAVRAAGSRQLIIPAAHFHPKSHSVKYTNFGYFLYNNDSVPVRFFAPVQFPVPYYATVEKLELMAYDYTSVGRIRVWLCKTKPATGNRIEMAAIDTGVASSDPTKPRSWVEPSINDPTVKPAEEAYLEVEVDPVYPYLWLFAVRVWYHPGT